MLGSKSGYEEYFGAEDNRDKKLARPYEVMIKIRGKWELWTDCATYEGAVEEAGLIRERGHESGIIPLEGDEQGVLITHYE